MEVVLCYEVVYFHANVYLFIYLFFNKLKFLRAD